MSGCAEPAGGDRHLGLVDLGATDRALGQALRAAVDAVARSGRFILGQTVKRFEQALACHCGVREAVGVACGSDALLLALRAVGVAPGDAVLTTPLSFIATAEAIVRSGASPSFADVDPERLCLDPVAVAEFLGRCRRDHQGRLREPDGDAPLGAIMPVHLYGRAAEIGVLADLAAEAGVLLVHDAAQALGATAAGVPAGSRSSGGPACLSFFPTKLLGAWGDGGAVLTDEPALAERIRRARVHGRVAVDRYDDIGLNSRLDALQAALLAVKLEALDEVLAARRERASRLDELFAAADLGEAVRPLPPLRAGDVPQLYCVRVEASERDRLRAHLGRRGIDSAVYYPTLLGDQPAIRRQLPHRPPPMPHARAASDEVLALPAHELLSDSDLERIVGAVVELFAPRRRH